MENEELTEAVFDYLEPFFYKKDSPEFGRKTTYANLKPGKYEFSMSLRLRKRSENLVKESVVIQITEKDGMFCLNDTWQFRYDYGMINDICPLVDKNKASIGFLLILLNLQSPAMEGNFCKEDKLEGSTTKAHSMLYSAILVDDDLHIETQKSISSKSEIIQSFSGTYVLDKDKTLTGFELFVEEKKQFFGDFLFNRID